MRLNLTYTRGNWNSMQEKIQELLIWVERGNSGNVYVDDWYITDFQ